MTSCTPCGADPSKYCPPGSSEQQRVGRGNYTVGVAGSFWPGREPPPDTVEGFRCDQRICDRGSICIEGTRRDCPSGKVCPFRQMVTAISCGDRHATADLDTYEHGTMVQVRCECKANFYAWTMRRSRGGDAGVPLAVPVAHLSDNETIHEIQCEVCPEVVPWAASRRSSASLSPELCPGPQAEQSRPCSPAPRRCLGGR